MAGDEATKNATIAVIASPAHIQPYTERRNAEIRSSAENGVVKTLSWVVGYCGTGGSLGKSYRWIVARRRPTPAERFRGAGCTLIGLRRFGAASAQARQEFLRG